MTYPAKPVLVGKTVRCKGCRNAFVLQADGIATRLAAEPAPAAPAAARPQPAAAKPGADELVFPDAPATAAVKPRPASPAPPRPAADEIVFPSADRPTPIAASRPAHAPTGQAVESIDLDAPNASVPETPKPGQSARVPSPRPSTERSQRRKSEQLDAARVKMAAELAAVAAKAADTEVAKREERKSERLAKAGATGKAVDDAKRRQRSAVLTGEGERVHRENLLWSVGSLAAVGVLALLIVVLNLRSAGRAALDAYCEIVPSESNRYPLMGTVMMSRAWLVSSPSAPNGPLIASDLGDASFGVERTIELGRMASALTDLKGLRHYPELGMWVAPADRDRLAAVLAGRSAADRVKAAAAARIHAVDHAAMAKKLDMPEDERRILIDLIAGKPSPSGEDFAKRMLDAGDVPDRIRLRPFQGRKGDIRIDAGHPPYIPKTMPYQGTLMRIDAPGWQAGWRVLELSPVR